MIIILDYGLGNVYNLKNALLKIGYESKISSNPKDILEASILFLPGVGAFKSAMDNLKTKNLISILEKRNKMNLPIVGICLGMQIMFEDSYEDGYCKGLGFLKGSFNKFDISLNIPHMGWNNLIINKDSFITNNLEDDSYVYFVHSYYLTNYRANDLISFSNYEVLVPGIVNNDNLIGMQFHPEKSSSVGLKILSNIIENYK